jgi:hypothetical protein
MGLSRGCLDDRPTLFGWALEMRLLASRLIEVTEGRDFPMHARIRR